MYGYEIPRYAREYIAEWRQRDRHLRLRRSLDTPGMYVLERKTRYLTDHPFTRGTDYQVQLNDGYRAVLVFKPSEIHRVGDWLARFDLQRSGAKALADELDRRDTLEREREERARQAEFEAAGSDAYDFLAWREGRRIAT